MIIAATAIGCEPAASPVARDGGEPAEPAVEEPAADEVSAGEEVSAEGAELRIVTPEEFETTIADLRGKVVLVDFWATWCLPCIAQFPHTVELHREYGDDGLAVVSMSLDYPEDKAQVLAFLREQGAEFENLLSQVGGGSEAFEKLDLDALPQYRLYDRRGDVQLDVSGDPAEHDLEGRVRQLLEAG